MSIPYGVYVDSNGTIFVADANNHRIQKWTPGATQGVTVAGGNGEGSAANQLWYPQGVYVDSNGNIFVADNGNHRIQKWPPGATQGITVAGGNGYGSAANQLSYPYGVSVDSHGNIFVADNQNHRIQKWTPGATQGITVAGGNGEGSAANQLSYPYGVSVDSHGTIFVADANNHRIQKVQYQPQIVIAAGQTSGTMSFDAINDLAFEGNETIVLEIDNIANASLSPTQPALNLTIIDDDTGVLLNLSNSTLFEGQSSIQLLVSLSNPSSQNVSVNLSFSGTAVLGTDYTVDKETINFVPGDTVETVTLSAIDDNLVEILESIQIQVSGGTNIFAPYPSITAYLSSKPLVSLSLDKTSMSESGGVATLTATLSAPTNQAVTIGFKPAGTAIYQGDYEATFVGKYEEKTVAGGNGYGSAANQLNNPLGVSVDSHGTIFVADTWNNRIQKWTSGATQGITVAGGNGSGSAANQLNFPFGVYVDSNGNVFVADYLNHRIQKWTPGATQGITVAGGNGSGSAANQLNGTTGVYVDSNGNIFVADYNNHRIQKWVPGATQGITVAGGNGSGSAANQLSYPSGISVDSNGNIFVADANNNRIQKWAPGATQGITVAGGNNSGSAANQLSYPTGVYVDSSGNVFVADKNNNRIQRWPRGATQGTTVAGGSNYGSAANQLGYPTGVYVDSNGNIFVADKNNNRIQKVHYQPQIIIAAGQTSGTMSFSAINDLAFEGNETIVLEIDNIANAILSPTQSALNLTIIDDDTLPNVLLNLSNSTLFEGQSSIQLLVSLSNPSSQNVSVNLSFSGTAVLGTDYTVDKETNNFVPGDTVETVTLSAIDDNLVEILESIQIQVSGGTNISAPYPSITAYLSSKPLVSLSLDKTSMSESGGVATLTATLSAPISQTVTIGFKPAGTATYRGDYEVIFVGKGESLTVAGGNGLGSAANQLSYPYDVYVDSDGNIFVVDASNQRIQKWTPGATQGTTVAGGNNYGSAANQLDSPFGVYVDSNGNIFIADYFNNRIQKWVPGATQGITVAGGNNYGSAANQLSYPTGVYVDSNGNIFVADKNNHRIQKWTTTGATQGITVAGGNGSGSAANQLSYPTGVYVDSNGNIFVADYNNHRIQKWVPGATQGITVAGGNGSGSAANQLSYPTDVYVDSNGTIFVVDRNNHRIQKWTPGATQGITVAGGNGEGSAANQLWYPQGVYVDSNGNIFVADRNNHRIQKVQYQPQLVIAAGQTSGTISFDAINDLAVEGNETIVLEINNIANAILSSTQSVFNLTIIDDEIALITTDGSRCGTGTVSLSATGCPGIYNWYASSTGGSSLGTGSSFTTPSISTTTTYYVDCTINDGNTSLSRSAAIATISTLPAQPGAFTASSPVVCQGYSKTYSIANVANASDYVWSYSGTGVSISGGTASVSLTYGTNATSGVLRVSAVGVCGNSAERTMNVTVIPQQKVINGAIANGIRHIHQASKSILLTPVMSTPITLSAGTVFIAEIVACPN